LTAKAGATRVVCISDTHLVHDQMVLPDGDVLVHAGDVMTESLLRHVQDGVAKEKGAELFTLFAGEGSSGARVLCHCD
jgi:predicted phosphodiesterase